MDWDKQCLRVGAAAILCAAALRLLGSGAIPAYLHTLENPRVISFLMYLESGRILPRELPPGGQRPTEAPAPPPETQERDIPVFSAGDLESVDIQYDGDYRPALETLLEAPLSWALGDGEPAVLILHTHSSESYTPSAGEDYVESSPYRTLDDGYNMVSIGDRVAQVLTEGGVSVLHDRELHDYPSYNGSYENARASMEAYLTEYPSIRLVLDLHRDAAEDSSGNQMDTGGETAQVMLVVGTDEGGLDHPGWEDNLSLALKLQAQLERQSPGITRPLDLRTERFNQDLSPGALLIEMGAAGNTHQEALCAAEALAEAILSLAQGANAAGNTRG